MTVDMTVESILFEDYGDNIAPPNRVLEISVVGNELFLVIGEYHQKVKWSGEIDKRYMSEITHKLKNSQNISVDVHEFLKILKVLVGE